MSAFSGMITYVSFNFLLLLLSVNVTTAAVSIFGQNCAKLNLTYCLCDKWSVTAPSWSLVQQDLKWIFLLHTYGYACLFLLLTVVLGFYTFYSILRSSISSRPYHSMFTINMLLCTLGASRAICLFIDPYNVKKIMPKVIASLVWDIGYPCITSAFGLIQMDLLQLTKFTFSSDNIDMLILEKFVVHLIIKLHFFLIIFYIVVVRNCHIVKYFNQTISLVWSILSYLAFLYAAYKIGQHLQHSLRNIWNSMLTRDSSNTHQKGFMQLMMLAYSNLATEIAALVSTLFDTEINDTEENEPAYINAEELPVEKKSRVTTATVKVEEPTQRKILNVTTTPMCTVQSSLQERKVSASAEVYVKPSTSTPSTAIIVPIITVSSPSRRSSLASRRGSDTSTKSSRKNPKCRVRFMNEEDTMKKCRSCGCTIEGSSRHLRVREEFENNKNLEDPKDNLFPDNTSNEITDYSLQSIHIVNRAKSGTSLHSREAAGISQIQRILNIIRAIAILGILLVITDAIRIYGPYGWFADTVRYGTEPKTAQYPTPWPWLYYQTISRGFEFVISCTMAIVIKLPLVQDR